MADTLGQNVEVDVAIADEPSSDGIVIDVDIAAWDVDEIITGRMAAGALTLPVFPPAIHAVRAVTARQGSVAELAAIATLDPVLALAVVRSNAASGPSSISGAVARMGASRLSALSASCALAQPALAPGPLVALRRDVWRGCVASSLVAEALAEGYGINGDVALFTALLHDYGKILAIHCIEDVLRTGAPEPPASAAFWLPVIERHHCDLGSWLAEAWDLPEPIPSLIAGHHQSLVGRVALLDLIHTCDAVIDALADRYELSVDELEGVHGVASREEAALIARSLDRLPSLLIALADAGAPGSAGALGGRRASSPAPAMRPAGPPPVAPAPPPVPRAVAAPPVPLPGGARAVASASMSPSPVPLPGARDAGPAQMPLAVSVGRTSTPPVLWPPQMTTPPTKAQPASPAPPPSLQATPMAPPASSAAPPACLAPPVWVPPASTPIGVIKPTSVGRSPEAPSAQAPSSPPTPPLAPPRSGDLPPAGEAYRVRVPLAAPEEKPITGELVLRPRPQSAAEEQQQQREHVLVPLVSGPANTILINPLRVNIATKVLGNPKAPSMVTIAIARTGLAIACSGSVQAGFVSHLELEGSRGPFKLWVTVMSTKKHPNGVIIAEAKPMSLRGASAVAWYNFVDSFRAH